MNSTNGFGNQEKRHVRWAGAIILALGVLAMLVPVITGLSVSVLVGVLVVAAGLIRTFWAFRTGNFRRGAWMFALGVLTVVAGAAMVTHPTAASGMLTLILTLYFIFDGAVEIFVARLFRPLPGWSFLLFAGIVSVLLGLMIWAQYPLGGAWAIGIFLGVKLLLIGGTILATGLLHSDSP